MPYKVFLVEDDIITREEIRNNFNWNELGYEFCGDATDGEMALLPAAKGWAGIVMNVSATSSGDLHVDITIRNETADWSAMETAADKSWSVWRPNSNACFSAT